MEAKRWAFAVTLTFLMAILPSTHYLINSFQLQQPFMGELKSIILGIFGGGSSSGNPLEIPADNDGKNYPVGPNLTSCHEAFGREGLLVYCCPPNFESVVPFVDFQFPDPSKPVRIRRKAHLLDENYIAKYRKALSIMKSLPYDDPRSFKRQANLHCQFCTGAYNEENSNNSPLDIHQSWLFFPWHRMLLFFHERIVGSLIGDDTFALPYWAWDSPEGMMIPEFYMNAPFFDKERDVSHFPPRVVDLDFLWVEKGLKPQEQIDHNMALMYNVMVSGAKKMELFMGCPYKAGQGGSCHVPGTIEHAPHNTMHLWVGSNLHAGREDMGVFYSAARDPIFYPHHTNIDRLWEVWRGINQNKLDISDPNWLNTYFFFYDENSRLVRIRIRDVLHMTKLGYAYEETDNPWLNARPKPSVPPKIAHQILSARENENKLKSPSNRVLSADFGPHGRSLDTTITVKVYRPKIRRLKKEKEEEEEVIVVYGIDVKNDLHTKFDVYVNVVDETKVSPRFREFAGNFVRVPHGVKFNNREREELMRRKSGLKLGISELLEDLEADGDESIWVTLIPRSRSCVNTTIDGIRIEYIR